MVKQLLVSTLLFATTLQAQNDSLPSAVLSTTPERIAAARKELLAAFLTDDPAATLLWRDSLMRLEDSVHTALVWDERWLLYYWEEAYGNLFDEIPRLDPAERRRSALKLSPPKDSLFEWLDYSLYEGRFQVYDNISRGFLTEEERQFALIVFDYLLRLNHVEVNTGEWNNRLNAFLKLHPESRFKPYMLSSLYTPEPEKKPMVKVRADQGFNIEMLFTNGRWRDELERSLRSPYGLDIGLAYWIKRWTLGVRCNFSWQRLNRSIYQNNFEWPKNDQSLLIMPAFEVGYDVINKSKIRAFPSLTAGISILKPPGVDEEEDNPLPDYYSDFFFAKGYLGAALTADIKLKSFRGFDDEHPDSSHISARVRVGYNWLNWGTKNTALRGDLLFFAIGINLFGHTTN